MGSLFNTNLARLGPSLDHLQLSSPGRREPASLHEAVGAVFSAAYGH